jgi:hypothetical protein
LCKGAVNPDRPRNDKENIMLYEIEVYEVTSHETGHDCPKAQTYVVESPPSVWNTAKQVNELPCDLQEFVDKRAHEASVQWGFVPVDVIVSHFYPAKVGMPGGFTSCLRSILTEARVQVEKVTSS